MVNGFCIVCSEKCEWIKYKNIFFIYLFLVEKVKKIYIDMKKKYEEVNGLKLIYEIFIKEFINDVDYLFENIKLKMV